MWSGGEITECSVQHDSHCHFRGRMWGGGNQSKLQRSAERVAVMGFSEYLDTLFTLTSHKVKTTVIEVAVNDVGTRIEHTISIGRNKSCFQTLETSYPGDNLKYLQNRHRRCCNCSTCTSSGKTPRAHPRIQRHVGLGPWLLPSSHGRTVDRDRRHL